MTPYLVGNLGGWHFLIILFVVLLLFGAPKLPALAKSLGQSMKILKKELGPEEAAKNEAAKDQAASDATKTSEADTSSNNKED